MGRELHLARGTLIGKDTVMDRVWEETLRRERDVKMQGTAAAKRENQKMVSC
jgi:DNA-binding winged helix-turn-helix (wHTH) protein